MEKFSKEKNAAIKAAINEEHFDAPSMLQEITPLINSYFITKLSFDGEAIYLTFLNGQKFRITAEEVENPDNAS